MKIKSKFCFDKSARSYDENGWLHVSKTNISKSAVNPYFGREIVGYEKHGLDPDKVYYVFRPEEELQKAVETFKRIPLLREHVPVTADAPQTEFIIGTIGSEVEFNDPYLQSDVCIWDGEAIGKIESGEIVELSCSYQYDYVPEAGVYDGVKYDGWMSNIKGNHVASVRKGRAGPQVRVADSSPFFKQQENKGELMQVSKKKLVKAFTSFFSKDEDLPEEKKEQLKEIVEVIFSPENEKLKIEVDQEDQEEDVREVEIKKEKEEEISEDSLESRIRDLLNGRLEESVLSELFLLINGRLSDDACATKSSSDAGAINKAMDALRADLRAAAEAAREVRPVIGDVACDSASELYKMALDQLGADYKGVEDKAALRLLFKAANSPKLEKKMSTAFDSSSDSYSKTYGELRLNRFRKI